MKPFLLTGGAPDFSGMTSTLQREVKVQAPAYSALIRAASPKLAILGEEDDFQVVDLDNPAATSRFGSPGNVMQHHWSASVNGNYVLTTTDAISPFLRIWELNGSTTPTLRSSWSSLPGSVAVANNIAYICDPFEFYAIDISNPAAPKFMGKVLGKRFSTGATSDPIPNLAISGNIALVQGYLGELNVIDISDPTSPTLKSVLPKKWAKLPSGGIGLDGSLACLADGNGYQMIDLSKPAQPLLRGRYDEAIFGFFRDTVLQGQMACTIVESSYDSDELDIYDLGDPANPALKSRTQLGTAAWSLTLAGKLALMVCNDSANELRIYDWSDPTSPTLKSITRLNHSYAGSASWINNQFAVSGSLVYMTDNSTTLSIYDISTPKTPLLKTKHLLPEPCSCIAMAGKAANILNAYETTAYRYDLSSPLNPRQTGYYMTPQTGWLNPNLRLFPGVSENCFAHGVGWSNAQILNYNPEFWFTTFSYADPRVPQQLGKLPYSYRDGVGVTPVIYYMIGFKSFDVVDMTHPEAPFIRTSLPLTNGIKVAADGRRAAVLNGGTQMLFVNFTGPLGESAAGADWRRFE